MSTQSQTNDDDLMIIILDEQLINSNDDTNGITNKLQSMVNDVKILRSADECIGIIYNNRDKKIFTIISDHFNQYPFLCLLEEMNQLHSFYIICKDHENYTLLNKFRGIFSCIDEGLDKLKCDILQCQNDVKSSDGDVSDDNTVDSQFVYSKILLEIILQIKYDENAIKDFTNYWRQECNDNKAQLEKVDEFEKSYRDHEPIWWYTSVGFLNSSVSKALRMLDVEMVIKLGFFIQDLYRDIERRCANHEKQTSFHVYRGQCLLKDAFEKLKCNRGGLISFHNFLWTTPNREISLIFAEGSKSDPDMVGVVFDIEIDPSVSSILFAENSMPDTESEIYISINTLFRIGTIETIDDSIWEVKLKTISDNQMQIRYWIDYLRKEIENDDPWKSLALLLNMMGYSERATEIYSHILKSTSSAHDYNEAGLIYQSMGNYDKALSYYEKVLAMDTTSLPSDHTSLAMTYNNIAGIHRSLGDLSKSLSFYIKALEIKQKNLSSNHPSLAVTYNNIGEVHYSMGDYSKALSFYEDALKVQQRFLPFNRLSFATTYNNIGGVHRALGNNFIAVALYETALNIEMKYLLPGHPTLATTYNNIGLLQSSVRNYPTALACFERALAIGQNYLPSDHPSLALFYNNMGEVHDSMKNYSEALSLYEKSLEILQKSLPAEHPELAAVHNNIGEAYRSTGDHAKALTYYEKTLDIEQKTLPETHPSLAITHCNMAVVLDNLERLNESIEHIQRAITITRHTFDSNHPKTQELEEYLSQLQGKL